MLIPSLDALLTQTTAKFAANSVGLPASGAFEALLDGLKAPVSTLADNSTAAEPGAVLPPDGKIAPPGVIAVEVGRNAVAAFDPRSDEPGDEPVPLDADSDILAVLAPVLDAMALRDSAKVPDAVILPESLVPAPVGPLGSSMAPGPSHLTASRNAKSATAAPSTGQQPGSNLHPTGQPAAVLATSTERGAVRDPKIALAAPAVTPAITPAITPDANPQASLARIAPHGPDAPKPPPPLVLTMAILPTGALPAGPGAASPPLRRGLENKVVPFALAVAPEPSLAAPATTLAAPIGVVTGSATPEPAAAPAQSPAQVTALPDHRALVEALVRARAERDPGVSVALETREFGAVALRFEALQTATGERALQVALSSGDPGFERAVASAAAAQAALADQSGRNPANRADPAPTRSADQFGDASGGRASQSDPQAQQRSGTSEPWRESRSRHSGTAAFRPDDSPATAPRPERRRGSIFA